MFYNFSKEAENVVEYATKLAARSGGLIATEHLLAGVLQVDDALAGRMKAFGMPRDGVLGFIDMNKARTNTIRVTDNASRGLPLWKSTSLLSMMSVATQAKGIGRSREKSSESV